MGLGIVASIPISGCLCDKCKQENNVSHSNSYSTHYMELELQSIAKEELIPKSLFSVTVDIKNLHIKVIEDGKYEASTTISVTCPKCSTPHVLKSIIDIPKIVFEDSKECDCCGGSLIFTPSDIDIEDCNGEPLVKATGILKCENCKKEEKEKMENGHLEIDASNNEWIVSSG